MSISAQVKELRQATGAGVLDCRKALEAAGRTSKRPSSCCARRAWPRPPSGPTVRRSKGVLELYTHGDGRVGVMVEVNCETDFVARTKEFRTFAHEMALQIAANSPR